MVDKCQRLYRPCVNDECRHSCRVRMWFIRVLLIFKKRIFGICVGSLAQAVVLAVLFQKATAME
jgi:hypothetical protein